MKAIAFADGALGAELQEHTQMPPDDLLDVLNALLAAGYAESKPSQEQVALAEMPATNFEVNPGYMHELRESMARAWA